MVIKLKIQLVISFIQCLGSVGCEADLKNNQWNSINQHGLPNYSLNFNTPKFTNSGVAFSVIHEIHLDPAGNEVLSRFALPISNAWIVLSENQYLLKVPFRNSPVLVNPKDNDSKWQIIEISDSEILVRDINLNIEYGFIGGQLVKIKEKKRQLDVTSSNGKILSISETVGKRTVNWLEFEYDALGNILSLSSGPIKIDFKYSEKFILTEVLTTLAAQTVNFNFEYSTDGLLTYVRQDGAIIKQFTWGKAEDLPKEYGLSQPDYLPPVRLIHDGTFRYVSGINRKGMNLIRIDVNGFEERLVYNPFTEMVISVDSNGHETLHELSDLKGGGLGAN